MSKLRSTGALSEEQHKAQDERYAQNHEYDYVFIGTGISALTSAALFAKAGKKVCMLEAHDIPGGYAHSFKMGDYHFCAQIHYIWGCAPGGQVHAFVDKLGLTDEITFELYDPTGYDHMVMPDGKTTKIPYGWDKLIENMEESYPGNKEAMEKFTGILAKIREQLRIFPAHRKLTAKDYLTKGHKMLYLLKYKDKTLQDVFDECGLSKEAQAVLIANCGDMMSPPEELSIFAFTGLFGGYNTGAYYPTKHYKFYIERIAQYIQDNGGHIYYETPVNKVNVENAKVTSVETANGKKFTAKENFVCNADPQMMSKVIGEEHFPASHKKRLDYSYAPAGMMIYLGLKDIDLKAHGFGKHNYWHMLDWDMNEIWKEQMENHNFEKPWFFISTPSLHTDDKGTTPEGGSTMEIATVTNYEFWKKWKDEDPAKYRQKKKELADRLLDLVEEHYVPNLREHIAVKVVGTNTTNEDYVRAPEGNAYGSALTPAQIGLKRLKADTPFENFWWCNASSGYAGFHGTTGTGMKLYMQLTGDNFYTHEMIPTDDDFVSRIRKEQGIN